MVTEAAAAVSRNFLNSSNDSYDAKQVPVFPKESIKNDLEKVAVHFVSQIPNEWHT